MTQPVLLFADRLWPRHVGGMEMHASAFIAHFNGHQRFPLQAVVSKDEEGNDVADGDTANPSIVFFNSGRWIEDLRAWRARWPHALFVYRTGGNEIIKAPLEGLAIADHGARQAWWAGAINETIDFLITNSAFTEQRLREIGVQCRLARCVGGVDVGALTRPPRTPGPPRLCSVARFVPYKNHARLIELVSCLRERGHDLQLRLVGDGPLLDAIANTVSDAGLSRHVQFLGRRSNEEACAEIAKADLYIQLSMDRLTPVPGGTYVHAEGMGRSILEALSAGTFVVAGKSGALSEVVSVDRGLLVPPCAPPAVLADLVAPLLEHTPQLSPTDTFSWEHLFARYERLWEAACAC